MMKHRYADSVSPRAGLAATLCGLLGLMTLWEPAPALARPVPASRTILPPDKIRELAPLLRGADVAWLEEDHNGAMKQIVVITFTAAPPTIVREVVIHPERYSQFVRNMTLSKVNRLPSGSLDHTYELSWSLLTAGGTSRYDFLPPEPGVLPPVNMYDADPGQARWHRWDFVPYGSGTLLVLSGYTDVHRKGDIIEKVLERVPSIEFGLALTTQLTMILAMKARAEQLAGGPAFVPPTPERRAASYDFLLDRGTLVLLRPANGRLSEMSLIGAADAPPPAVLQVLSQPSQWSQFIPSITRSTEMRERDGSRAVDLEQSISIMTFRTQFGVHISPTAVDMLGLSGDLRGARLRWDVSPRGARQSQVSLRTRVSYDRASVILRQLFKLEPLFEYGVNVGLTLLYLQGVRARFGRAPGAN